MGVHPNIRASSFPRQGGNLGRRAQVGFYYDPGTLLNARCIRDDAEAPWRTIFLLEDGRVVLSSECQYRFVDDDTSPLEVVP